MYFFCPTEGHQTHPTFSSRSLICLLWISVLSSRSRILCNYDTNKKTRLFRASTATAPPTPTKLCCATAVTGADADQPGGPGAAAPSSPGGSGSRTLGSSSASASSVSPPLSAAHPSEAHSEARRTLSPRAWILI